MSLKLDITKREDHECSTIAQAEEFTAAQYILEDTVTLREKLRVRLEGSPRHCPEDLTQDCVFIMGAIAALNAVISAPADARASMKKRSS